MLPLPAYVIHGRRATVDRNMELGRLTCGLWEGDYPDYLSF